MGVVICRQLRRLVSSFAASPTLRFAAHGAGILSGCYRSLVELPARVV